MQLPFTRDQFIGVFQAYHDAIGGAPLLLIATALGILALAYSEWRWRHRVIGAMLAALWLWSGAIYHWGFFTAINPAARIFGAAFVVQAVIVLVVGSMHGRWRFDPRSSETASLGWLLIVYALIVYPALGWIGGHGYPRGPSFGAPCPITIFFLGMVLWSNRIPVAVVVAPVVWALVGTSAAAELHIYEDYALTASAVIVFGVILLRRFRARRVEPALHKG